MCNIRRAILSGDRSCFCFFFYMRYLPKPTDLDLHCLQRQSISGFSRTRVKGKHGIFRFHLFSERVTISPKVPLHCILIFFFTYIRYLPKPADLDLHCLQRQGISGFSRTRVKGKHGIFRFHLFSERETISPKVPLDCILIFFLLCFT